MKCRAKDDAKRSKEAATALLVFGAIGLLVLLPSIYVLSDGPAVWLDMSGYLPSGFYERFYAPLVWASKWHPFDEALCWYESWFYTDDMLRVIYPERY